MHYEQLMDMYLPDLLDRAYDKTITEAERRKAREAFLCRLPRGGFALEEFSVEQQRRIKELCFPREAA